MQLTARFFAFLVLPTLKNVFASFISVATSLYTAQVLDHAAALHNNKLTFKFESLQPHFCHWYWVLNNALLSTLSNCHIPLTSTTGPMYAPLEMVTE
jgi:hypothetical protein